MKTDSSGSRVHLSPPDSRDFDFRYTEESYRALIDQAPDAIFISDHKFRLIEVNARGCEMSGYSRDEVLRKSIFDFMVPDEVVANPLKLDELKDGRTVVAERRLKRKDGAIVPVEVTSKALSDGRLQAIVRDISRRKRAEKEHKKLDAALRQSEERLRLVLDGLGPHMFVGLLDLEGHVLQANRNALEAAGLKPEDVLGQRVADTYWFAYSETVAARLRAAVESAARGEAVRYDEQIRVAGGQFIWLDFSIQPLRDESDKIAFLVPSAIVITERKQAETALRDREEQLRLFVQHAPVAIAMFDTEMRYLVASERWLADYGLSGQDVYGNSHYDVFPEIEERWKGIHRRCLAGAIERSEEDRFDRADGSVQWLRWEVRPWYLASGDIGGIIIFSEDISDRKQAEEALSESEARLRLSVGAANVGLWDWDLKTNEVYYSPEWKRQIGYRDDELSNDFSEWESRVHPDDLGPMLEKIRTFLANPQDRHEAEFRFRHKDSSYRWIYTHGDVLCGGDGKPERMLGCHIDITERKQAEAELRESEERFAKAFRSSPMAVALSTLAEGRFIDVNDAFLRMFGFQRQEVINRTSTELRMWFDPVDRAELAAVLYEKGGFRNAERQFPRHDGQLGWALCAAELVELKGEPCVVSLFNDITERKQAEEQLRASTEQLRALSARLLAAREEEGTRIAREIHDELGGVLTGLKWDIEECEKALLASTDAEPLGLIRKKIPVMTGLLDTTIDTVRRISSELRPGVLDDLGLVAAIEWQAQQFQQRTGIECPCEAGLETIDLNRDHATAIFRIFQEVLTNVIRHAQATRVEIKVSEASGEFVLEVTDNGRGISESERQNTRSLGLLGMRERVQLIGGKIEISGAKGKGTRVVVSVPVG